MRWRVLAIGGGDGHFPTINRELSHDGAGGQQHRINRSQVVVLAVEQEEDRVTDLDTADVVRDVVNRRLHSLTPAAHFVADYFVGFTSPDSGSGMPVGLY